MHRTLTAASLLVLTAGIMEHGAPLSAQSLAARADSVFSAFIEDDAPGCAVGVDSAGKSRFRGAYGMAELEFGSRISPTTIFEAGSVSKQFTAAAVLLLAERGVLSLDDTLQRWFPEIPTYQAPITIRHLILHSSGLRDWGAVASLAGWPRGQRAHNHDDALAIIARQQGLNHQPGAAFSYTNTGYNLLAMLVERASGTPLATFTHRELFEPLGMTHTSWRDDYTRLVPGRAQAYSRETDGWHLDMPFEYVHGNGGLLTTVDDLLTWTQALHHGRIGNPDVSRALKVPGVLNDGSTMGYGGGLFLGPLRGLAAVHHGGATAGYRSVLAMFVDADLAVAILCNRGNANPQRLAEELLDGSLAFEPRLPSQPTTAPAVVVLDPSRLDEFAGTWHSTEADGILLIAIREGRLEVGRRPGEHAPLRPVGDDRFLAQGGVELHLVRNSAGRAVRLLVSAARARDVGYDRVD